MLSMLTLLPATAGDLRPARLLALHPALRRRGRGRHPRPWRRIADRVSARAAAGVGRTIALLLVFALGNLNFDDGLTTGNSYRDDVESVEGQELLVAVLPGRRQRARPR